MLHYLLHAGLIIALIAAAFFGLWWRKRARRPQQGDFAALCNPKPAFSAAKFHEGHDDGHFS